MERWINFHELHCYRPKEQEFDEWYNNVHLPDVVETQGYIAATRYQIKEFKKGRGSYLTIYEIKSADIDETIRIRFEKMQQEIAAGRGSDFPINVWPFVLFQLLIRKTSATQTLHPDKQKWIRTVETNPVPGMERAFNEWYDQYLEGILELPEYVAASRYRIKDQLEGRGKYLTIYEIESEDIEETVRKSIEQKSDDVCQGKESGLCEVVWGTILYRQLYHYPSE